MPGPIRQGTDVKAILEDAAERSEPEDSDDATIHAISLALSDKWYALDVQCVARIVPLARIFPVPCTPSIILGIVNLRGEIVTVVDLRAILRLTTELTFSDSARIVVVEQDGLRVGLLVDSVQDMLMIPVSAVQKRALESGMPDYLRGEVEVNGRVIGLLNLQLIMNAEELRLYNETDQANSYP